ncbi:hypothetical protein AK86_03250 [Streptococcus pneumoniae B1599]|nr:hypothetical protein AK86_03250 [Streptococcus pneumoniae B1599]
MHGRQMKLATKPMAHQLGEGQTVTGSVRRPIRLKFTIQMRMVAMRNLKSWQKRQRKSLSSPNQPNQALQVT